MPAELLLSGEHKANVTRQQLWRIMHDGHGKTGHAFNVMLIILIIISVALLPLEIFPAFNVYRRSLATIEVILTSLFTVEYLLRIYAAPQRLRYVFSFYGLVDLVSILPFYLGFLSMPWLRALRMLRLLKLGEIEAAGTEEDAADLERGIGLTPDEHVEYIVSRHPIFLLVGTFPTLFSISVAMGVLFLFEQNPISIAIAVTLILFALIFFWKTWLDYSYDLIYITSRRLIFQNQHLLGRSINQVNYYAITNVKPSYTSIISYLMGYGSIVIDTPSAQLGKVELHIVRGHEKAAHLIMAKCTARQDTGTVPGMTP